MPKTSIFLPVFRQTGLFDLTLTSIYEKSVHTYSNRFASTSASRVHGATHPLPRGGWKRPERPRR